MLQNIFIKVINIFLLKLCLILLLITGCSSASSSFAIKAKDSDLITTRIQGLNYRHTLYKNKKSNTGTLHVYLGGDGTPWFKGRYITQDPTPLKPVMLDLMKMDKFPAIYLGRPCYHQQKMPANCDNSLWTSKRYSATVVNSMASALKRYIRQYNINKVSLFGFSGGGTLAMLLAPQIKEVDVIVTLAGNLDTDAWTAHHRYAPLTGSLNPARQPILSKNIRQFHYLGEKDKNILIKTMKPVIKQQKNALLFILKQADHHCCWAENWNKILATQSYSKSKD